VFRSVPSVVNVIVHGVCSAKVFRGDDVPVRLRVLLMDPASSRQFFTFGALGVGFVICVSGVEFVTFCISVGESGVECLCFVVFCIVWCIMRRFLVFDFGASCAALVMFCICWCVRRIRLLLYCWGSAKEIRGNYLPRD
jgi:hypothetical protein